MTTPPKMTLSAAVRITGHCRATLDAWVERGWLPTEEFIDGRDRRVLVGLDGVAAARETARRSHHRSETRDVWRYDGDEQPIPAPGTKQYKQLGQWVRRNRLLIQP